MSELFIKKSEYLSKLMVYEVEHGKAVPVADVTEQFVSIPENREFVLISNHKKYKVTIEEVQ